MEQIQIEMSQDQITRFDKAKELFEQSFPLLQGSDLFYSRIKECILQGRPLKLGIITCMPKLEITNVDGTPQYSYAGTGFKNIADYRAEPLSVFKNRLKEDAFVDVEFDCLVADTEAMVKCEGYLNLSNLEVTSKADKVVKRILKNNFQGSVTKRSERMPLASDIYQENFKRTFQEILAEFQNSDYFQNTRFQRRYSDLINIGIEPAFAQDRALRDMSLQDTEYAMEGIWIVNRSEWDGYLFLETSSVGVYTATTSRLINPDELPVLTIKLDEA